MSSPSLHGLQSAFVDTSAVKNALEGAASPAKALKKQAESLIRNHSSGKELTLHQKLQQAEPDSAEHKALQAQLNVAVFDTLVLKGAARRNQAAAQTAKVDELRKSLRQTTAWTLRHQDIKEQIKAIENEAARKIQRAYRNTLGKKPLSPERTLQIRQEFQLARDQEKRFRRKGTIDFHEPLAEGFTLDSHPDPSRNEERTVTDRRNDPVLAEFLENGIAKIEEHLKQCSPQGAPSEQAILNALKKALTIPAKRLPPDQNEVKLLAKLPQIAPYFQPQFKESGAKVPLGAFIESGIGVCRHRALLTKKLVDALSPAYGIKASLHKGHLSNIGGASLSHMDQLPTDWKGPRLPHMWNRLYFTKSGQEYLIDTESRKVIALGHTKTNQNRHIIYTQNEKFFYIQWEALKKGKKQGA